MKPSQAAKVIGCSASHTRWLIREGRLKARRVPVRDNEGNVYSFTYVIRLADARKARSHYRPSLGGFPRGHKRRESP